MKIIVWIPSWDKSGESSLVGDQLAAVPAHAHTKIITHIYVQN
jgi:hypothetical protein